jgi:cytochrome c oxidase subunit II
MGRPERPHRPILGRNTAPRRRSVRWPIAAAPLLFLSSCQFGAPRPGTSQGGSISHLYQLMWYMAIPVGAIVYGLIIWSIIRYRRSKDPDRMPKQFRYHIPIEVLYTAIPIFMVIGLFVVTYDVEKKVDTISADPPVFVRVTAFQWQWRFDYPRDGISIIGTPSREPTLVLPAGQPVVIRLLAADVDHAFFIPDFLFKRDALPGFPNQFQLNIDHPGVYRGECAEFCGLNHADMNFVIRAVSPPEFRAWLAQHRGSST